MAITRCPNGHFYDSSQNAVCPWCNTVAQSATNGNTTQRVNVSQQEATVRVRNGAGSNEGATVRVSSASASNVQPLGDSAKEGHTVAVVRKQEGLDPVVGWLVCIEGADKGRDYRIRSEKNSIGRSETMDICVNGDETIARNDHAFIVYDPKRNAFRVQAGLSRGLVYLNGNEVINSEDLKAYDTIELGETAFKFVPFCGEGFKWRKNVESEE